MSGSHGRSDSFPELPVDSERRTSVDGRPSIDYGSPVKYSNGYSVTNGVDSIEDPVERLQLELERTRDEKEALATQYRNLLAKLTQMRTSLGNKLKQDAVRNIFFLMLAGMPSNYTDRKSSTDGNNLYSSSQWSEMTLMLQLILLRPSS
jgi:hypothetical protein